MTTDPNAFFDHATHDAARAELATAEADDRLAKQERDARSAAVSAALRACQDAAANPSPDIDPVACEVTRRDEEMRFHVADRRCAATADRLDRARQAEVDARRAAAEPILAHALREIVASDEDREAAEKAIAASKARRAAAVEAIAVARGHGLHADRVVSAMSLNFDMPSEQRKAMIAADGFDLATMRRA